MESKKTACILCSRNCGLEVEVQDGHLVRIRGDEAHPVSQGYVCQKAARLDHYQNHAERLTRPLMRQPDGSFLPVSWDRALSDIAGRLLALRRAHGGHSFAFYGGGGQGNHLGGLYSSGLVAAMGSPYVYSPLAQEKTGDFWVNGRLFGRQTCHTTEDVEHADYALFIGTNPWQAHGIRNARDTVRSLGKDPARKMAVIDPVRTETAALADVHLQLRPGTDAFLLAAMLAILVQEELVDRSFLAARTTGFAAVEAALRAVPVTDFVRRAGVELAQVQAVVRDYALAPAAAVRVDLGLQQSLHSTLNSYLEKLLFLLTGHFGKAGCNNFHAFFLPLIGHSPDGAGNVPTRVTGMRAIGKLYPPNVLPAEIEGSGADRIRALFVDSANPLVSAADTAAYERAFAQLELLVVVDVALTETARRAHYVLPAASQFEKWEATGFNLEFPDNAFHLRAPLFAPPGECLPEPEIYRRLLQAMGALPDGFPVLRAMAAAHRRAPGLGLFPAALALRLRLSPALARLAPHVLYQTLGPALPDGAAAAAPLWGLARGYAQRHARAVARAGHRGAGAALGESLFSAILSSRSGTLISRHDFADTWSFVRHEDGQIHLEIPELLAELAALAAEPEEEEHPLVLIAGERRAYNANTIYRDPAWRKSDPHGALAIHPADAARLGLAAGDRAVCRSARGAIEVHVEPREDLRPGVVALPHGYGLRHGDGPPVGPELNRLTDAARRDAIAGTPYHKYVPVTLEKLPPR